MQKNERELPDAIRLASDCAIRNRRMTRHRGLFSYANDLLTHAHIYSVWQEVLAYLRRFRMLAFLLRITTVVITVIETGALVLLTTAVFLVILPITAALLLGILLTALLETQRSNRMLSAALADKRVYLLFLPRERNPFFAANARSLSLDEGNAVIIVSPYWLSSRGLRPKSAFYATVRQEERRIYLIRRYYFFRLRRQVLNGKQVAYLF